MNLIMQAGQFVVGVAVFFYGLAFITWVIAAAGSVCYFLGCELVEYLYKLLHPKANSVK